MTDPQGQNEQPLSHPGILQQIALISLEMVAAACVRADGPASTPIPDRRPEELY